MTSRVNFISLTGLMALACDSQHLELPTINVNEGVVVTDLVTQGQVRLTPDESNTLVEDLSGFEDPFVVEGDYAFWMDDESYTEMMEEKRQWEQETWGDGKDGGAGAEDVAYALSGSGSYSISSTFTTPRYYKTGTSSVKASASSLATYNPDPNHSVAFELKRRRVPWTDTSYGKKYFWVPNRSGSTSWSSATVANADYYLVISIPYSGYWDTGRYSLYD